MDVTIYHNPKCSNSRGALERIRSRGIEPRVIEYLKTPPSRETLRDLLARMGLRARDLVRAKEPAYSQLDLAEAGEEQLLDAMAANPVLINRPIVVTNRGARLCRPPEVVDEIL